MAISTLKNPLTEEYFEFKNYIFEKNFPWYINISTRNEYGKFFFSHNILARPNNEVLAPIVNSNYFNAAIKIIHQIIKYNDLKVNSFMRINVNLTLNHGGGMNCSPHYDHPFPHKNLIIYLNQTSGPTVVINPKNEVEEFFHPKEDAIIIFEGKHYHYQPDIGEKRVVLVATYI